MAGCEIIGDDGKELRKLHGYTFTFSAASVPESMVLEGDTESCFAEKFITGDLDICRGICSMCRRHVKATRTSDAERNPRRPNIITLPGVD